MKNVVSAFLLFNLIACTTSVQDYDVVILNGRVMDPETEFDAVRNVGIKDGRIVTITEEEITGTDSVDAVGYVVTAGFIDTRFSLCNAVVTADNGPVVFVK